MFCAVSLTFFSLHEELKRQDAEMLLRGFTTVRDTGTSICATCL